MTQTIRSPALRPLLGVVCVFVDLSYGQRIRRTLALKPVNDRASPEGFFDSSRPRFAAFLAHLEVVQERLEREFDQAVIFTAPSVAYKIHLRTGEEMMCDNPASYPDEGKIESSEEPYIRASIITPSQYLGNIMSLCVEKRGIQTNMQYLDQKRVEIVYEMPLAEVLFDFYDRLKSVSRGYASFDYDVIGFKPTDLCKIDILINSKPVDALSQLSFRGNAYEKARHVCEQLREEITRQQFKIAVQGAIGGQLSQGNGNALRKDVLAKCYGAIFHEEKAAREQKEGADEDGRRRRAASVRLPRCIENQRQPTESRLPRYAFQSSEGRYRSTSKVFDLHADPV